MNTIIKSIVNGQRKQALRQLVESGHTFAELVEELIYQERYTEVHKMIMLAETTEVITVNEDAVKEF